MSAQAQEARIALAIAALKSTNKMSICATAKAYQVPQSTLEARMKGRVAKAEKRNSQHILTVSEEDTLVQYIIDLDTQGFPPQIESVQDIANLLQATRQATPVSKLWPYNFIQRRPELKTRFSRAYDFQQALCEDPKLIKEWFRLVANMRSKYGIQDTNLYNFDETGFIIGVICGHMVVTRADRRGQDKQLQPRNCKWATAVECVSGNSFALPPFLIVQGTNHQASWYTDCNLPLTWAIKTTPNGWTDN